MNFLFILVFACSTYSNISLTLDNRTMDIKGSIGTVAHYELPPTCTSEVKIVKTEFEVLGYFTNPKYKTDNSFYGAIILNQPDKIYRLDTKTGEMKQVEVKPIVEVKKKMVEQEEKIIKGYEIK